jgi:AcrR family transcriptional regulator
MARHLTREDWIAAARKVLMRSGIEDVKVDRLSRDLKITRGSFYWHFTSRKDLLDALLHDWEGSNLKQIDYLRAAWKADKPDLAYVNVIYLGGDQMYPAFDMSVRFWARKAAYVAAAVHRIDDAWIRVLSELFLTEGFTETEAFVRARINYFHQIGYYALDLNESIEARVNLIPYYYKVLAGRAPSPVLHSILNDALAKQKSAARGRKVATRKSRASAGATPRSARANG